MTEHERLLIETNNDVKWLKDKLESHLAKHWRFTVLVMTLVIGAILTGKLLS